MKIKEGDKVVTTGLVQTQNMCQLDEEGVMKSLFDRGVEGIVTWISRVNGPRVQVCYGEDDLTFWYHVDDLKLVEEPEVTLEDFDPEEDLKICQEVSEELPDIGVGDLVTFKAGVVATGVCLGDKYSDYFCEGEEYEVDTVDGHDGTVLLLEDQGVWVHQKDLVLSVAEVEEKAEEEEAEEPEVAYIITNDSVTLTIGDTTDTVVMGSPNFSEIREAVLAGNHVHAQELMNPAVGITKWGNGALQIEDDEVLYGGMKLTGKLVERVLTLMGQGDDSFIPLANFLTKVMEHESFTTRMRLMDFAAHDKLDLTEDGSVIAFKNVRDDYMDKYSGKFDNRVGNSPSMPRADVNDDHDVDCAEGLHVCSPTYLKGFWGTSGRTMKVIVKPKNFVAIPYTYSDSKARVCEYTVVEEITDSIDNYL